MTLALAVTLSTASTQNKNPNAGKKTEKTATKSTLDQLVERATNGDAQAMLLLGKAYYGGLEGAPKDYKTAAKWFLDAAEVDAPEALQYSTEAKGWLGLLYYNGEGVNQDHDRAMKLFLIATRDGYKGLVETFDDMSKGGDVFACKFMQECYDKGVGVKRNTDKAAHYQRLAADAGDQDSYMPVGLYLYNNGKHSEAFGYFEDAAKLGNYRAAYFCGIMLYDGDEGVDQDRKKGMTYLQQAAEDWRDISQGRRCEARQGQGRADDKNRGREGQ